MRESEYTTYWFCITLTIHNNDEEVLQTYWDCGETTSWESFFCNYSLEDVTVEVLDQNYEWLADLIDEIVQTDWGSEIVKILTEKAEDNEIALSVKQFSEVIVEALQKRNVIERTVVITDHEKFQSVALQIKPSEFRKATISLSVDDAAVKQRIVKTLREHGVFIDLVETI